MSVTVRRGDPRSPAGTRLLEALHAYLTSIHPPERRYTLAIGRLCVPEITFFLAEEDGRALGCAALARREDADGRPYGEVKSMWVDPEARGRGAGDALLDELERQARADGLPVLRLETATDLGPAVRLYERHGYERRGVFGSYREWGDSVFMEKRVGGG
jgi:putative acetyltransferase